MAKPELRPNCLSLMGRLPGISSNMFYLQVKEIEVCKYLGCQKYM